MSSRILVVDAVPTNRIILRVKLSAAYYEVLQAATGMAALAKLRKTRPDLVICAANLPDMTGQAFCDRLRQNAVHPTTPVVILQNGEDPGERLASLAAGADEVLSRPIDDLVMLARVRALLRARDAEAELLLRDDTRRALGLAEAGAGFDAPAQVHIVRCCGPQNPATDLIAALQAQSSDNITLVDADDALGDATTPPDVVVVAEAGGAQEAGLRLLPLLRGNPRTRHAALVYLAAPDQKRAAASALDMGADDLVLSTAHVDELAIRLKKQITRKRTNDRLRANVRDGLRAAVTDPLTGLYNRRYAVPHLSRLAERATRNRRPYALLLADLDFFKQINDKHGHGAGDAVLVCFAQRFSDNLRAADLVARWGGEEFLIAMPDATRDAAHRTAQRLCALMAGTPVTLPCGERVTVTLSIGIVMAEPGNEDAPLDLVARADRALYGAKNAGRNRVVMAETVTVFKPRGDRPTGSGALPGPAMVRRKDTDPGTVARLSQAIKHP